MTKTVNIPRHPAKYTDALIPYFYEEVKNCSNILDPFAGTGKIATIKDLGYNGTIYANDIERDWLEPNIYGCDYITFQDSEYLDYEEGFLMPLLLLLRMEIAWRIITRPKTAAEG